MKNNYSFGIKERIIPQKNGDLNNSIMLPRHNTC